MMADPELGGSGFQTNVGKAIGVLKRLVPISAERTVEREGKLEKETYYPRKELDQALALSGMTDSLPLFRLLVAMDRFVNEDHRGPPPGGSGPPADGGGKPPRGNGRFNYTHPRGRGQR